MLKHKARYALYINCTIHYTLYRIAHYLSGAWSSAVCYVLPRNRNLFPFLPPPDGPELTLIQGATLPSPSLPAMRAAPLGLVLLLLCPSPGLETALPTSLAELAALLRQEQLTPPGAGGPQEYASFLLSSWRDPQVRPALTGRQV
jgi:hypothetical protein